MEQERPRPGGITKARRIVDEEGQRLGSVADTESKPILGQSDRAIDGLEGQRRISEENRGQHGARPRPAQIEIDVRREGIVGLVDVFLKDAGDRGVLAEYTGSEKEQRIRARRRRHPERDAAETGGGVPQSREWIFDQAHAAETREENRIDTDTVDRQQLAVIR